jgi:phage shock protein A
MYAGSRVDEAFSRFDLLEKRVDLAEGRADALALAAPIVLEHEIAALRTSDKAEAELAAMKASRGMALI